MTTQVFIGTFFVEYCYKCGIPFGLTNDFRGRRLDDGQTFYCPSGHNQCFTKSNVQRLEEKLAVERRNQDNLKMDLKIQERYTRNAQYRARAEKGAKTRMKNRIANGVCPCCNRTFKNVHRHMKNKHPKFNQRRAGETITNK